MILQTVQSREAYEKMCQYGVLKSDGIHIFDESFRMAYKWMAEQLSKKTGIKPDGEMLPVWAWYQWEGKRYPEIKHSYDEELAERKHLVLITFNAPDDVVLLSDFDYWHFVLNDLPISEDGKEECDFSEAEKEKSWQKVFEVDFNSDNNYSIQAVLWEIKQEWVKCVDFLEF